MDGKIAVYLAVHKLLWKVPVHAVLWSRSRPEPDFLAGAGAGEKAPGCCCLA